MNLKANQKIMIAAALYGVLIVAVSGIVVYPLFQGVVNDHKEIVTHKRDILQLREDIDSSREFEMFQGVHAREFDSIESLFVESASPIAFFRFLDQTATPLGLEIEKSTGSVQQVQADRWSSFEIRLTGVELYQNFMNFLQKLENAPYLLEIQSLTFSAAEEGKVEFSLSIKAFTR